MALVSELFEVTYGHSMELNRLKPLGREKGGIAFVSRTATDNGVSAYVAPVEGIEPSPAGVLTCALGGSVLSTFLQEEKFYSGYHIALLRPLVPMSKSQLLFYCYCIAANQYRYSYGRQANRTLKHIVVPGVDELPDYVERIEPEKYQGCNRPFCNNPTPEIDTACWKSFRLTSLFELRKGQRLTKTDMRPGSVPYVGASDAGNGVTAYIGQAAIHEGGTISVSYNGSVAEAFYQPVAFWATDDVNVLYPKGFRLTAGIALFICTVLRLEKYRFNYGREWHLERMRESIIKLPVTVNGTPDWQWMERYTCTLPYSSQIFDAVPPHATRP